MIEIGTKIPLTGVVTWVSDDKVNPLVQLDIEGCGDTVDVYFSTLSSMFPELEEFVLKSQIAALQDKLVKLREKIDNDPDSV